MVQLPAMGHSMCALVLLCATSAAAQPPMTERQPETGRAWLDRCGVLEQARLPEQRRCLGWIEGLVDINEIYRGLGALDKTSEGFCTPPAATVTDAAQAVVRYFREHPDALHFSARILAYMALRHAFPCERRTP